MDADCIHGDIRQVTREKTMRTFKDGKLSVLIATDVASRGIDVDDVDCVINYDVPEENEYYVHRIGRTGRAGKKGMKFVCPVADGVEVVAAFHQRVYAIVHRNKADALLGKVQFRILSHLQILSPQAAEILDDEGRHLITLNHLDNLFPWWRNTDSPVRRP